jgi:polyhydroxyalkanoate synthesis repressor PhaR
MSEPRVIKRYANRKLYDTQSSQYVTLDQIAQMIRAGEEVRVLDNNSKDDLTSVTLAQIIFEEEKRQKSFIPLGAMRHLIQSGGASLQELAQQAQARVLSVFRKGENDELRPEQLSEFPEQPGISAAATQAATTDAAGLHSVRELLERSQQTVEEWQRRADERLRHLLESLSPFASLEKEVQRLAQRVEQLEAELSRNSAPATDSGSTTSDTNRSLAAPASVLAS